MHWGLENLSLSSEAGRSSSVKRVVLRLLIHLLYGLVVGSMAVAILYLRGWYSKAPPPSYAYLLIGAALSLGLVFWFLQNLLPLKKVLQSGRHPRQFVNSWRSILAGETELSTLLTSLVSQVAAYMKTNRAAIIVRDEEGELRVIKNGFGSEVDVLAVELMNIGEQRKETVLASQPDQNRKVRRLLREARSEVLVPLLENNYLVGLLVLGNKVSGRYGRRDLGLLSSLTKEAAGAIQQLEFSDEVRRLNDGLRREIAEARSELKIATERLEDLTTEKEQFIAALSNRLHRSLVRINECIASAAEFDGVAGKEERERLKEALSASKNLLRTVDDLVVASGTARILQITPVEFSLDDLIFHILREEKPGARSDIELSYRREDGTPPAVRADPDKLKSALSNLIDGALGSTQSGSVVIETKKEDCEVVVSVSQPAFNSSDEAPIGKIEAAGLLERSQALGFLASKRIIEAHKGRIWVESSQEAGRSVRFSLPVD